MNEDQSIVLLRKLAPHGINYLKLREVDADLTCYALKEFEEFASLLIYVIKDSNGHEITTVHDRVVSDLADEIASVRETLLSDQFSTIRFTGTSGLRAKTVRFFDLFVHRRLRLKQTTIEYRGKPVVSHVISLILSKESTIHRTLVHPSGRIDLVPQDQLPTIVKLLQEEIAEKSPQIYNDRKDRHVKWNDRGIRFGMLTTLFLAAVSIPIIIASPFFSFSPLPFIGLYWLGMALDVACMIAHSTWRHRCYQGDLQKEQNHPALVDVVRGTSMLKEEPHPELTEVMLEADKVAKESRPSRKSDDPSEFPQIIREHFNQLSGVTTDGDFRHHFLETLQYVMELIIYTQDSMLPVRSTGNPVAYLKGCLTHIQRTEVPFQHVPEVRRFLKVLGGDHALKSEERKIMVKHLGKLLTKQNIPTVETPSTEVVPETVPETTPDEVVLELVKVPPRQPSPDQLLTMEDIAKIPDRRVQEAVVTPPKKRTRTQQLNDLIDSAQDRLQKQDHAAVWELLQEFPDLFLREVVLNGNYEDVNLYEKLKQILEKPNSEIGPKWLLDKIKKHDNIFTRNTYDAVQAWYKKYLQLKKKKSGPGDQLYNHCKLIWFRFRPKLHGDVESSQVPLSMEAEVDLEPEPSPKSVVESTEVIVEVTPDDESMNEVYKRLMEIRSYAKYQKVVEEIMPSRPCCIIFYHESQTSTLKEITEALELHPEIFPYRLNVDLVQSDDPAFQVGSVVKIVLVYAALKYEFEHDASTEDMFNKFKYDMQGRKDKPVPQRKRPRPPPTAVPQEGTTGNVVEQFKALVDDASQKVAPPQEKPEEPVKVIDEPQPRLSPDDTIIHVTSDRVWKHYLKQENITYYIVAHNFDPPEYEEALKIIEQAILPTDVKVIILNLSFFSTRKIFPSEKNFALGIMRHGQLQSITMERFRQDLGGDAPAQNVPETHELATTTSPPSAESLSSSPFKYERIVVDGSNVYQFMQNNLKQHRRQVPLVYLLQLKKRLELMGFGKVLIVFSAGKYHAFKNKREKRMFDRLIEHGYFFQAPAKRDDDVLIIDAATVPKPGYILTRDQYKDHHEQFNTMSKEFKDRLIPFNILEGYIRLLPWDEELQRHPPIKKQHQIYDPFGDKEPEDLKDVWTELETEISNRKSGPPKKEIRPPAPADSSSAQPKHGDDLDLQHQANALQYIDRHPLSITLDEFKEKYPTQAESLLIDGHVQVDTDPKTGAAQVNLSKRGAQFLQSYYIADAVIGKFDSVSGYEIIHPDRYNTSPYKSTPLAPLENRKELKAILRNCFVKETHHKSYQEELQDFNLIYRTWKVENTSITRSELVYCLLIFGRNDFNEESARKIAKDIRRRLDDIKPTLDYQNQLVEVIQELREGT